MSAPQQPAPGSPPVGGRFDVAVVGGGIVGLASAMAVTRREPRARIAVLEKEDRLAVHQSGRNSGVIHSGIYYRPGSLKARFCTEGRRSMVAFCRDRGIPVEVCGKVIVATSEDELPRLEALHEKALANGVEVRRIGPDELGEVEPEVQGIAALHVPEAAITDYGQVAREYAAIVRERGGHVYTGAEVRAAEVRSDEVVLETTAGPVRAAFMVNCAGLYSDRLARMTGVDPGAKIVPFRGEYFELVPERTDLVRGLVYPVPDPRFPFLGVHFTRTVEGGVHAGPNAVLALAREGYRPTTVEPMEALESLTYPGLVRLGLRHWREGTREVARSLSRELFTRSLQRLVPAVEKDDLVPAPAGVRAQALTSSGELVDDFLLVEGPRSLHVCNAPSPAATASIPIGEEVASRIPIEESVGRTRAII